MLTQAHTHMHTPRQLHSLKCLALHHLSINKQLGKKIIIIIKANFCLRTHRMRWLVVLLSKHTQEDPQLHASSYHDYYTYIHTIRIIKPLFLLLSLKDIVKGASCNFVLKSSSSWHC